MWKTSQLFIIHKYDFGTLGYIYPKAMVHQKLGLYFQKPKNGDHLRCQPQNKNTGCCTHPHTREIYKVMLLPPVQLVPSLTILISPGI